MFKQNIASAFVALTIVCSALAGCASSSGNASGNNAVSGKNAVSGEAQTSAVSSGKSETAEKIVPETVDKTYTGYKFRIFTKNETQGNVWNPKDVYAEAENGDLVNDAVFRRNAIVEEKYGVDITMVQNSSPAAAAKNSVLAGDDFADALYMTISDSSAMAGGAYLYDLAGAPVLDVAKPWWDGQAISDIAIKGRIYLLLGDLNIVDNESTWCIQYNKRLAADYKLGDLYAVVRNGKWTMDALETMCKSVTRDLNGDGKLTHEDQWGMLDSKNSVTAMFNGSGSMLVSRKSDGTLSLNTGDKRVKDVMDRLFEFYSDREMQLVAENITSFGVSSADIWTAAIAAFTEGRALFRISVIADINSMRDMEDEYGMLPMPKYDESQEKYCNTMQAWNGMAYTVPKTAPDIERTCAVLEYLSYASSDTLKPAYYNIVLTDKLARDKESVENLDLIFSTRIIDLGMVYNWGGVADKLKTSVTNTSNTISSDFASAEESIKKAMDDTYSQFAKSN